MRHDSLQASYDTTLDLPSSSCISTSDESGMISTGTVPLASDKFRLNFSVFSRTLSSMIVTLKHCLWVEGSEVKAIRGLLEGDISS